MNRQAPSIDSDNAYRCGFRHSLIDHG